MDELKEQFELLTEIATDLSLQFDGVETESRKAKTSTYYLAKMVHSCWSLNTLLPSSETEYFDYPSIAAICRNIIELTNLCWYHCIEETSESEEEFRFLLYELHDATALLAIATNLSFQLDEPGKLEQEKIDLKNAISSHVIFDSLSPDVQRQVKKGRKSTLLNQIQIVEARGIDSAEFQGLYKLLSTHTHSTATSIKQVVHSQLHSSEMDQAFLGLTVHYTSCFIAELVRSIGTLWNMEFASKESGDFIDHYASQVYKSV